MRVSARREIVMQVAGSVYPRPIQRLLPVSRESAVNGRPIDTADFSI